MPLAHAPGGIEQPAFGLDLDIGAAELAVMAALDVAAELGGHGHLAVADAEHRNAGIEDRLRRARRACFVHRFRAAGEDHRLRLHLREGGFGLLERHDFGIDALLAHPARDQLRHLAAEIDDQNLVMRRGHGRHRLLGWLGWGHGKQLRDRGKPGNPERAVGAGLSNDFQRAVTLRAREPASRTRCSVLHNAPQSRDPKRRGEPNGPRIQQRTASRCAASGAHTPCSERALAGVPNGVSSPAFSAPTRKTRRFRCGAGSSASPPGIAAWRR